MADLRQPAWAQTSMRSRPSSGSPRALATMSTGRAVASSATAQNSPFATSRSTSCSAFVVISALSEFSAVGASGFAIKRRKRW